MKRQNVLKVLFFSLILSTLASSCGLIDKFKTSEEPTDSNSPNEIATSVDSTSGSADDLFTKTMNETKDETALTAGTDAPSNIDQTAAPAADATADATKDELKTLEDEFSGSALKEVAKTEPKQEAAPVVEKQVKVEESIPQIKEELPPAIAENTNQNAGKVMNYKVQKGETLMQIAFKIYGDISKWKDIKKMNGSTLSKNSALRSNMTLKYTAPSKEFVWNPEGSPHMIKNGETLGTISKAIYQTPKKWKSIWENNKPLIKNPNVIYAGFTLYTKAGAGMANYVQPKSLQKIVQKVDKDEINNEVEEVKVDRAISKIETNNSNVESDEIDLTKETQSAPIRNIKEEVKADELSDEALNIQ